MSEDEFCVVIPAFNEVRTIGRMVEGCQAVSGRVYVVDDGSTDDTARVAEVCGATVLRNNWNRGLGSALRRGFRQAVADGFGTVGTLDGDGVHRPMDLDRLVKHHIARGADLTLGSRAGDDLTFRNLPRPKAAANRLVQLSLNRLFGGSVSDWLTGLRVVGRRPLEAVFRADGYAIAVELLARGLAEDWVIAEAPITVDYGAEPNHSTTRRELEDFLGYCANLTGHPAFSRCLEAIKRNDSFGVAIEGTWFECQPVIESGSYVIQQRTGPPPPSGSEDWLRVI